MPHLKGSLSLESIGKMREAKLGKKKGPHSEEHKARISAANKGKVRERKHQRVCACGAEFMAGVPNAIFCSVRCKRAARGHGLRHAPQFAHLPQLCAICAATDDLVGDHDHATGNPRGILCRNCNLALGHMLDAPDRLRAAADYLEGARQSRYGGVYICGPMSGKPLNNYPAFNKAARQLRALGHRVLNPAENPAPPCGSWLAYMRMAVTQVAQVDVIVMLPGWEQSRGANVEYRLAVGLGLKVWPLDFALTQTCRREPAHVEHHPV